MEMRKKYVCESRDRVHRESKVRKPPCMWVGTGRVWISYRGTVQVESLHP